MLTEQQRKRVFAIIFANQCLGMLSAAFFQNGFFLNYFTKLGISSAAIAFLFALPPLIGALLMLPFAFLADRMGKLRLALFGQVLTVAGMGALLSAGWGDARYAYWIVIAAILIFSVGGSLQGASWFALLNPIIPREIRGRFFGRLRVTFQTVTIVFSVLITRALDASEAMPVFQVVIGIALAAHVVRYFTYARIPELEKEHAEQTERPGFRASLAGVFRISGFARFNGYILLLTLFTAGVPIVFGLMQKDVFGFSPAQITLMGTLFLAGSVLGNLVGGSLVDRCGTRFVFLISHISYAFAIAGLLARYWVPLPLVVQMGACSFLFSMIEAVKGVAVTSEVMALIPSVNRSLSTAVCMTLFSLGVAVSGLFVSRSISWELFPTEWQGLGHAFSAYDALLLGFAGMIVLMLAAIGLVPKIVRKAQVMPGSGYPRF